VAKDLLFGALLMAAGLGLGLATLGGGSDGTSADTTEAEAVLRLGFTGIHSANASTAGSGFADMQDGPATETHEEPNPGETDPGGTDPGETDPGETDPDDGQCTEDPKTQGYWKNHEEAWPVDSLTLGDQTYSQEDVLALFNTPVAGDASLNLAHQLAAAKLNVANGAHAGRISSVIATADGLLSTGGALPQGVAPSSPLGQSMIQTAGQLDAFNNGR